MPIVKLIFALASFSFLLSHGSLSAHHSLDRLAPSVVETSFFPYYALAKVRIYNRTDWNVQVYINGYHVGEVWGDHNAYFNVYAGAHRVVLKWPGGHTEWFDFVVARGNVHKIWTSDWDG